MRVRSGCGDEGAHIARNRGNGKVFKKPGKLKKDFFAIDAAADGNDYVIYQKSSGKLFYDANGAGAGAAVQIASLKKGLQMTEKDFFII